MMQRFDHARIALLEHSKALSAVDRINGFKDTVALNENYQIVGSEDCLGQTELGDIFSITYFFRKRNNQGGL